jgi:hypothetical protein
MDTVPIKRPKLTMPDAEAMAVWTGYAGADVILEYGSGGSTVLGAEMPGKTIFSVESDATWLADMHSYFAENPPLATLHLHHGDIGPTKEWGFPKHDASYRKWHRYPLSVWELPEFLHPDLVFIDGRFRPACFLTALFRITRTTTVLWDDYIDRPNYHIVEKLVKPITMIGRMALFEISPMAVPVDKLAWVLDTYLRPN